MSVTGSARSSSPVRFFEAEDIPQVVELHRRVFRAPAGSSLEQHQQYFSEVFLNPPARVETLRSLVYCDGRKITGFLGTVSRPMLWNGERVQASISSQFIVDPASRGFAGVELLRTFFSGPQDISIADESNRDSRRLWEALGGATSLVHSMQWFCPLRPCRFALSAVAKKEPRAALFARIGTPLALAFDALASRVRGNPFRARKPDLVGEELDDNSLCACLAEFTSSCSLHPIYDVRLLVWLLGHAGPALRQWPPLKRVVVKSEGRTVGWYIYCPIRDGISEVLQLFALKGHASEVLGHLAYHAELQGSLVLRGRCEPGLAEALSQMHWPCHWGPWMLVHSRRPGSVAAFQGGDVFFSRLDGEWCLRFH